MPKPRSKPTPVPPPKRPRRLWLNVGSVVLAVGALVAVVVMSSMPNGTSAPKAPKPQTAVQIKAASDADFARFAQLSARDLVAMSDAELEAMDPLVMNMVVAKGVPDLAGIDFAKYARVVDGWADRIGAALIAREPGEAATSPAYRADPDIWRAGGMAMALAGSSIGIGYSRDVKMPVLYMAVAHRLGWPLKAVAAADHMWCRWDDGKKRFNLEATSSTSEGGMGSFATPPDDAYRTDFKVSPKAEEVGSDLGTLSARQTLGVYLQQRAGYYRETGKWQDAEADLLMARLCFPQNRDILRNLLMVMDERGKGLYTPDEWARLVGRGEDPAVAQAKRKAEQDRLRQQLAEVDRINRENQRQRDRNRQPPDR
jgi:hypothetical protein